MNGKLDIFGNHRGGTSLVTMLPERVAGSYEPNWILADPKQGRAERLADLVNRRMPAVRPRPLNLPAQIAIAETGDDDDLVLTMDTVSDVRETLASRRPRQRAVFQMVGRGPGGNGGARIAFGGVLRPGDKESERGASLFLETLERMTREASSRALTATDPLTAVALRPMRDAATRQTIRQLAEREWDPRDLHVGPLTIVLGTTVYPLVPVQSSPADRFAHRRDLALETAARVERQRWQPQGATEPSVVVAVVERDGPSVHFMRIGQRREGELRLQGVTSFEPRLPGNAAAAPALFTD